MQITTPGPFNPPKPTHSPFSRCSFGVLILVVLTGRSHPLHRHRKVQNTTPDALDPPNPSPLPFLSVQLRCAHACGAHWPQPPVYRQWEEQSHSAMGARLHFPRRSGSVHAHVHQSGDSVHAHIHQSGESVHLLRHRSLPQGSGHGRPG
ncbi:unnamed protein product [Closterium sp. Yama58-4]|nr:unnamed protein product [Closterium sp. Yama58-4]